MCLERRKRSSTARVDGISYDMFRTLPDLANFRDIFIECRMSVQWRMAMIVFKQDKNLDAITNYRPIALLFDSEGKIV